MSGRDVWGPPAPPILHPDGLAGQAEAKKDRTKIRFIVVESAAHASHLNQWPARRAAV